jgi:hypothetical protein
MNKTESKTLNWLMRQGTPKEAIHYQARRSPDFILADGRGFEAKRIVGNTIFFGAKQFEDLKRRKDKVIVLAFTDQSEEPIALSMSEIEVDRVIKGVHIVMSPPAKTMTVEFETWQQLTKIKIDLNLESLDAVIKELIKKWKKT